MSQKEMAGPIADLERSESASENLSRLAELARQAYEQKRTKDCLDLTRAILLIDPDHAQAQSMRSALQLEMHRDLENAREFLRQAAAKETHEEEAQTTTTTLPAMEKPGEETVLVPHAGRSPRQQLNRRLVLRVAMIAGVAIIFASLPRPRTRPAPVEAAPLKVMAAVPEPVSPPPAAEAAAILTAAPDPPTVEQVVTPSRSAAAVPVTPRPTKLPDAKVIAPASGTLAVEFCHLDRHLQGRRLPRIGAGLTGTGGWTTNAGIPSWKSAQVCYACDQ